MKRHFQFHLSGRAVLWLGASVLLSTTPGSICAQPVAHHFDSITALPDQTIKLSLDGCVSNMFNLTGTVRNQFMQMFDLYLVEVSSNLDDWTPLAMPLRTNSNPSQLTVDDTNALGLHQRFYRTVTNHLLTAFPKPSGPFTVGTVDRVMIDPARTNLYRYSPPTNTFMVTFWYPADPPAVGVLPAPMWGRWIAADTSMYVSTDFDAQWAKVVPKLVGHRFRDVPVSVAAGKLPVVLYSHGVPTFRKLASQRAEELASHGYVVVAMEHSDCWATEFPDGRYLAGNRSGDLPGRLRDMTFLLDELAVLNDSDPLFAGRLDLDRIGVTGGGYGGMVVETCRTNNQVKCAALYDAWNVRLGPEGLQKPFLVALGETNAAYSDAEWLFNKAIKDAVFLQIRGADHFGACDIAWMAEVPWGLGPGAVIDACFVWFFDTYLKGESPKFPANPQIYNVKRK